MLALLVAAGCGDPAPRKAGSCDGPCPASKINHIVIIQQENHTFDNYFGDYCTAPPGSAPTCTEGPACCEAGPDREPSGALPIVLDDDANGAYDPDHSQGCELMEANGGLMDRYVTGTPCSDPRNFARVAAAEIAPYRELVASGAMADRYFQPISGQSAANNMYFVRAQWVFTDNDFKPDALGQECSFIRDAMSFPGPTIGHLLDDVGVSWAWYVEGYDAMADSIAASGQCPRAPDECPFGLDIYPCIYDPSDIPIAYYADFADDPRVMRDFAKLQRDLDASELPQVVFVRGLGFHTEHPGLSDTISDGTAFVRSVIDAVQASAYGPDTLVLVTWDEGGGYFDPIAPPPDGVDNQPYGTRVPFLVTGPFAKANTVSHVVMEHSSVVKFIEWNWLGMQTGQLGGRDATVANLGSLLDPAATGAVVRTDPTPARRVQALGRRAARFAGAAFAGVAFAGAAFAGVGSAGAAVAVVTAGVAPRSRCSRRTRASQVRKRALASGSSPSSALRRSGPPAIALPNSARPASSTVNSVSSGSERTPWARRSWWTVAAMSRSRGP